MLADRDSCPRSAGWYDVIHDRESWQAWPIEQLASVAEGQEVCHPMTVTDDGSPRDE